jgi:hypothetical protein
MKKPGTGPWQSSSDQNIWNFRDVLAQSHSPSRGVNEWTGTRFWKDTEHTSIA